MFTDRVSLKLKAGKGGNGVIAWRREKYIPKGGPCGGDGGCGGSVILEADAQIPSLEAYRNRRLLKAQDGGQGGGGNRKGKNGADLILKVPCGTLVKDCSSGVILFDFIKDKDRYVICSGGKGGRGNTHFKSATNRAPIKCTPGREGNEIEVELELKLIADVGLVGFPNAGKSTLMEAITDVSVKIAPYPFTTLRPNLGYVYPPEAERILIADIPGIIAGAHVNRGLGFEFLRHIERTHMLLFVLDAAGVDGRNPTEDYTVLLEELRAYNPLLLQKPSLVLLNKIDSPEAEAHSAQFKQAHGVDCLEISALSGEGIERVIEFLSSCTYSFEAKA